MCLWKVITDKCHFFKDFIYLFMRDTQREAETQTEGETGFHAGSLTWDPILDLQDHTLGWRQRYCWATGTARQMSFLMYIRFEMLPLKQVLRLGFITVLAHLTKSENFQCHSDVGKWKSALTLWSSRCWTWKLGTFRCLVLCLCLGPTHWGRVGLGIGILNTVYKYKLIEI